VESQVILLNNLGQWLHAEIDRWLINYIGFLAIYIIYYSFYFWVLLSHALLKICFVGSLSTWGQRSCKVMHYCWREGTFWHLESQNVHYHVFSYIFKLNSFASDKNDTLVYFMLKFNISFL